MMHGGMAVIRNRHVAESDDRARHGSETAHTTASQRKASAAVATPSRARAEPVSKDVSRGSTSSTVPRVALVCPPTFQIPRTSKACQP